MILLFFTGFEDLWKNCDDGRRGENEFDGPGKFFIPSPVYLTASDIPKRLFKPIYQMNSHYYEVYSRYTSEHNDPRYVGPYSSADQANGLKYFNCFLKGISELSNTTFTSTMKKELMEISIGYTNVELTNVLANDENFRSLFESKDDLGRTFIQEYLHKSRFSVVSFHLCTILTKKCHFSSGCGT